MTTLAGAIKTYVGTREDHRSRMLLHATQRSPTRPRPPPLALAKICPRSWPRSRTSAWRSSARASRPGTIISTGRTRDPWTSPSATRRVWRG